MYQRRKRVRKSYQRSRADATKEWRKLVDQNTFITIVVSVVTTFGASSGFWAPCDESQKSKIRHDKVVNGLAYDRITYMGMKFIEQKIIYKDEYEDFRRYL